MAFKKKSFPPSAVLAWLVCIGPAAVAQTASTGENRPPAAEPSEQAERARQPAPAAAVGAEATPAAAEGTRRGRTAEEEIVVTGSRIRRKDLTTPAPVTVITREQVQASGKVSIGDFLQSLPEQGNAINTQVNNGGNGATRISLRGLGTARTLVLVNGRRFVLGGNGANDSVDLNSIPAGAVERIEVLKDGASAVYGSDAIAGVVNIITRKRGGTDLSAFSGTSKRGDGTIYDLNATTGASADRSNFVFSAGYYRQQPVWGGDRDFSKIPRAYDGSGKSSPSKTVGEYSQGSGTVPAGTFILAQCTSKTAPNTPCMGRSNMPNTGNDPRVAAFNALIAANPNTDTFIRGGDGTWRPFRGTALAQEGGDGYNFAPDNYLVTPSQRISLYSTGHARVGDFSRAYFEGSFVNRQSEQLLAAEPLVADLEGITVSAANAYNPFGVDLGAVRRRLVEFGSRSFKQDINTFRAVGGVDGTLPEFGGPLSGWFWDVSLNYGRSEGTQLKTGNLKTTALRTALGATFTDASGVLRCGTAAAPVANCVPLNLFGGPGSITQDQITGLTYTGTLRAINQMTAVQFNTTGELLRLFADRPIGLAAGYEYRFVSGENVPDPITVAGETTGNKGEITRGQYYVNEGYAELSIPVVSGLPFAEDIEATAAVRGSRYSTFGSRATYKLGGRWRPIRDFTFRGTYSSGFRAPSISDLFLGQADSFPNVSDPCRGAAAGGGTPPPNCAAQGLPANGTGDRQAQLRTRVGGNPGLRPERAKIFTAGVVVEPSMVKNLSVTVDYYNVTVDDSITSIGARTILAGCYPVDGQPKFCDLVERDPATGRIINISNLNTNVGKDETDGIDLAVHYALPTSYGRFGFAFDGTWLHKFDRTLADGTVIKGKGKFDIATTGGVYPAFKFLSGVSWGLAGFGAGVNLRYVSAFTECGAGNGNFNGSGVCFANDTFQRRVSSYNQWDVFASYTLPTGVGRTTLAAGVNNVFDRAPSTIYNGFTAASDPTAYDFMGRFMYARVGHAF
jgi:outer membrane receptor protein involved in Fe transport